MLENPIHTIMPMNNLVQPGSMDKVTPREDAATHARRSQLGPPLRNASAVYEGQMHMILTTTTNILNIFIFTPVVRIMC